MKIFHIYMQLKIHKIDGIINIFNFYYNIIL
jgi:hypothetical protein